MDFLHELDVKRFEPVPGWGDEEEAGMDEGVGQVTSLDLSFQIKWDSHEIGELSWVSGEVIYRYPSMGEGICRVSDRSPRLT